MATVNAIIAVHDASALRWVALIEVHPCCALPPAPDRNDTRTADESRLTGTSAGFVRVERAHDERIANSIDVTTHPFVGAASWLEAGIWSEVVEPAACLRGPDVPRDALEPARHRNVDERPQRAIDE